MTTKLTAKRFRIRRPDPVEPLPPNRPEPAAEGALFTPLEDGFGNQSFLPPEPDQTEPEPPKAAEPPPAVAAPSQRASWSSPTLRSATPLVASCNTISASPASASAWLRPTKATPA